MTGAIIPPPSEAAKLGAVLPVPLSDYAAEIVEAAGADLPPELVAAICWRESRGGSVLSPPGPTGTGDNGHGRGLMQVDDRTWGTWLACHDSSGMPLWQIAGENLTKGAEILRSALTLFPGDLEAGVDAYNASPRAVRAAEAAGGTGDEATTGKNYGADVLRTALAYHSQIKPPGCDCILCRFDSKTC